MNAPVRNFEAKTAVREHVPLLIGLVGPSSSGKTKSALLIAEGIQSIVGGDVFGIDTESRRMGHYAAEHRFQHVEFNAPFGSLDYLAALRYCAGKGGKTIIVDSATHEHEGPGGLIDFQEKELDRLAGDDWAKRERVKMLAWQKPKAARRQLISGLLQLNANFIFCFRAREKTKPMKVNGKTEIVELGFMPIAGEEFLFEMTVNCMLPPKSNGVPVWQSEHIGERGIMKLPSYLAHAFPANKSIDVATGRTLALWAKGTITSPVAAQTIPSAPADPPAPATQSRGIPPSAGAGEVSMTDLDDALAKAAANGKAALEARWKKLSADEQKILRPALERRHWPTALQADAVQTKGDQQP